jgi:hypothetical protein
MAVDNSRPEVCERPPLTSCSKSSPLLDQKKRTIHLLQIRTTLFALDTPQEKLIDNDAAPCDLRYRKDVKQAHENQGSV